MVRCKLNVLRRNDECRVDFALKDRHSAYMKEPYVYILASKPNGTLYVGVTSNLQQRVWQHKEGVIEGFTKKYQVHNLVYFEVHETLEAAIVREKQIKDWQREWKIRLINDRNPDWDDLTHLLNM